MLTICMMRKHTLLLIQKILLPLLIPLSMTRMGVWSKSCPTECNLIEPWSQAFFFDGVMDIDDNDEYFLYNDDDTWVGWQSCFNMFQWIDNLTHLESSMGVQSDHFIDCLSVLTEESDSSSLSPAAYKASLGGQLYNPPGLIGAFPVIFDSGASKAISGRFKEDFVKGIKGAPAGTTLGGMADGMTIAGEGLIQWTFFYGKTISP